MAELEVVTGVEVVVVEGAAVVELVEAGQLLALYPLDPAMTTWNPAQYCPSLWTSLVETTDVQYEHLILVVEAGSVQLTPGSRIGLRSK